MPSDDEAMVLPSGEDLEHALHDALCESLEIVEDHDLHELTSASSIHRLTDQARGVLERLREITKRENEN